MNPCNVNNLTMPFHELNVQTHDGDQLELNGENGKPIDAEMCEFIAWELIDGDNAIPANVLSPHLRKGDSSPGGMRS